MEDSDAVLGSVAGVKRAREEVSEPARAATTKKAKFDTPFGILRKAVNQACKDGDVDSGLAALDEMISKALAPTAYVYSSVLSLCFRAAGGIDARIAGKAQSVFRAMAAAGLASEPAYTSIIRICALGGDIPAAREHLLAAEALGSPLRLRTYSPLMAAYARAGDLEQAEWVWRRLVSAGLRPSQAEYAMMLEALGQHGGPRAAAAAPRLLSALSEHEFRLTPTTAATVRSFFAGELEPRTGGSRTTRSRIPLEFGGCKGAAEPAAAAAAAAEAAPDTSATVETAAAALDAAAVPSAAVAEPAPEPAPPPPPGWPWHIAEVAIPRSRQRHVCPVTETRLAALELSDEALGALAEQAAVLAQGDGGRFAIDGFRRWLSRATDGGARPFDTVIDGANIGFSNQNFAGGALMYTQVRKGREACTRR